MFGGNSGAHRDRAQPVTKRVETKNNEEAEADAQQRVEKRLHADAIDDEDEQREAENEGERLQPDERAARGIGSGSYGLFREFFCISVLPVFELLSRLDQG